MSVYAKKFVNHGRNGIPDTRLFQSNGERRGGLEGTGIPVNGDHIAVRDGAGIVDGALRYSGAGRAADEQDGQQAAYYESGDSSAFEVADQTQAEQAETEHPTGNGETRFFPVIPGHNGNGTHGQNGNNGISAGSNGSGRKRTA